MKVTLRYFASIRETMGCSTDLRDTSATTLAQLRDELIADSAAAASCLARSRAVRMALNQVMSEESAPLSEACEVAFFPPVTGG